MINRKFPRYVRIDRSVHDKLKNLRESSFSIFNGRKLQDIFMYGAVMGCKYNLKKPLGKDKVDLNLYTDFSEEYKIIMDVIAFKESGHDLDKIVDGNNVVSIVQEYAFAGILQLYDLIYSRGTDNPLEQKVIELLNEFNDN